MMRGVIEEAQERKALIDKFQVFIFDLDEIRGREDEIDTFLKAFHLLDKDKREKFLIEIYKEAGIDNS